MKYVVGFCFDHDLERVLLVRKARPEWQVGRLNGVGGKVEEGESPRAAMEREFAEETGGQGPVVEWAAYARLRGKDRSGEDFEVWFFHARVQGKLRMDLDGMTVDGETLYWILASKLGNYLVVPNLLYLVPMAKIHFFGLDSAQFFDVSELAGETDGE